MSGVQIIRHLNRNSFFGRSLLNNLWTTATIQRQITTKAQPRKKPKCLYVQGPIQWVKCKVKFQYLKYGWDWEFSEKEFKEGTKQVNNVWSFVVEIIGNNYILVLKLFFIEDSFIQDTILNFISFLGSFQDDKPHKNS